MKKKKNQKVVTSYTEPSKLIKVLDSLVFSFKVVAFGPIVEGSFSEPTPAHLFNWVREMMWETRELAWGENGGKAWAWPETRVKTWEQGQKRLRLPSVPEQAAVSLGRRGRGQWTSCALLYTLSFYPPEDSQSQSLLRSIFYSRLSLCDPIPESSALLSLNTVEGHSVSPTFPRKLCTVWVDFT